MITDCRTQMLTSAWIQSQPDTYSAFLDMTVQDYCRRHIEPSVTEIDHIGVGALADILLKPAGIAMEILYLDQTPGTEANTYQFNPMGPDGREVVGAPTLRLLYRP